MRISSNLYYQTGLNSINRQQADLMHVFQQIGSKNRMLTPADDPLAAAQTITLSQSQGMNKRFAENREVAMRTLGEEENTLNSLVSQMQGLKTRLVEAANGLLSDTDRSTLAGVLRDSMESMLGLANTADSTGQYLFSGSKGNVQPYQTASDGKVEYKGDSLQRNIQVDQTRRLPGSDNGIDIFNRANPGVNAYVTGSAALNEGTGQIAKPIISNPQAAKYMVGYDIEFTSETEYTVTASYVNGLGDDAVVQTVTSQGTYDPASSVKRINLPTFDADGNELPDSAISVAFEGKPVAGDRFTAERVSASDIGEFERSDINMFDTLHALVQALEKPIAGDDAAKASLRNQINGAFQRLDINYDNVLTVRASVGARMNEIDALSDTGALQALHITSELSRLEDLDYYSASTRLELQKTALEASALAFQKIQSTSLFSMLAGR